MNNMFNRIPAFKWFVLQNFPFIEEDFDAITNYQLLCKIVEYLNTTIDKTNELGNQVEVLTNWFNNLDVQDEIDNKLDTMAQDGTLDRIINENIFNELNAKIDTLEQTTNAKIDTLEQKTSEKFGDINKSIDNLENPRTILIGDSYAYKRDDVEGWAPRVKRKLKLNDNDCYIFNAYGGGFVAPTTYLTALQNGFSQVQNPETIKRIVVIGGDNDIPYTYAQIQGEMLKFSNYVKQNFPNAIIYVGMFMFTTHNQYERYLKAFEIILDAYSNLHAFDNMVYLNNIQYAIRDVTMLLPDNIHLNEVGQNYLSQKIYNCIVNGSCVATTEPKFFTLNMNYTPNNNTHTSGYLPFIERQTENVLLGINTIRWDFDNDRIPFDFDNGGTINLATYSHDYFFPYEPTQTANIPILLGIHTDLGGTTKFISAYLTLDRSNNFSIYIPANSGITGNRTIDVLQIAGTSKLLTSRFC